MDKVALYAGSFDPLTLGHLDIIERASLLFDRVVIGVVANPNKDCLFTLEERVYMVRHETMHLPNVIVERFSGLLADYVNAYRYDAVIRGIRDANDYDYERSMSLANEKLYKHNTDTVFLLSKPELSYISSSMVKEIASLGGDIKDFVTYDTMKAVNDKFRRI